ncbi:hypothetical protein ACFSCX_09395 [Bacillus salitolerans]|uniref:Glucosyltransferase 3-like C-terminal domain-containing protein n=1 Tax=Bacillus salitolerans TaxID=1437434 RepID=A0ABW4LQL4_9BACI
MLLKGYSIGLEKIKRTVILIGFQAENEWMYPHLYDFLAALRKMYEEVTYIGNDSRHEMLFNIDNAILDTNSNRDNLELYLKSRKIINLYRSYKCNQKDLLEKLRKVKKERTDYIVIAIDDHAFFHANLIFPGNVVFWSHDIFTVDSPYRIKNGLVDILAKRITKTIHEIKGLIIQDEHRKLLFEETVGRKVNNSFLLPVSLLDSYFCLRASHKRINNKPKEIIKIIQSGAIIPIRASIDLIKSFQYWEKGYELHLRGYIDPIVKETVFNLAKKPIISEGFVDNYKLPKTLNEYDIAFIGYKEKDSNFSLLINASGQLVSYLRLGIPIIAFGTKEFNDFVERKGVGIGISSFKDFNYAISTIKDNYKEFSINSRKLFTDKYEMKSILDEKFQEFLLTDKIEKDNFSQFTNRLVPENSRIQMKPYTRIINKLLKLGAFSKLDFYSVFFLIPIRLIDILFKIRNKYLLQTNRTFVIYGASEIGQDYYHKLVNSNKKVLCYLDSSSSLQGTFIEGIPIFSVEQFLRSSMYKKTDVIIISSYSRAYEIRKVLQCRKINKPIIYTL